jgi:hypothetical protein
MICANGAVSIAHQSRTPSAQLTAGARVGKAIAQRRANGRSSNRAPIAQLRTDHAVTWEAVAWSDKRRNLPAP